jgi:hypothetical protein
MKGEDHGLPTPGELHESKEPRVKRRPQRDVF